MQTHRNTIARLLQDKTGLPYQKCLSFVVKASQENRLPKQLDSEGIARSVEIVYNAMTGSEIAVASENNTRGQVVSVCSTGAVSGAHELSVILANELAGMGRVCLIDTDTDRSGLPFILGYTPFARFCDMDRERSCWSGNDDDRMDALKQALYESEKIPGFQVLVTGHEDVGATMSRTTSTESYEAIIQDLRRMFDYIVIDAIDVVSHRDFAEKVVLGASDYVIVAINPTLQSVFSADSWVTALCRPGHPFERNEELMARTGYIACEHEHDEYDEDMLRRELGQQIRVLGSVSKEQIKAVRSGRINADFTQEERVAKLNIRDIARKMGLRLKAKI